MTNIIKFENQDCTITFNLETKSITGIGFYVNHFFRTYNETTRGIKKASKDLKNIFDENTNIYQVVDYLNNHSKIRMTFNIA